MIKPFETITDKDMILLQIDMALDLVDLNWFIQLTDFLREMEGGSDEPTQIPSQSFMGD